MMQIFVKYGIHLMKVVHNDTALYKTENKTQDWLGHWLKIMQSHTE